MMFGSDDMGNEDFSTEEKVALFDEFYHGYFERNFGTMAKVDIDTLLFDTYLKHLYKNKLQYDDYTLSNQLGITQNRVRTLKERAQVKYPRSDEDWDWKEEFAKLIPNAKYDSVKKLVKVCIGDVVLMNEIRHHFISKGWYDEYQLNPLLFQCRLDYFILLCSSIEQDTVIDENAKTALKALRAQDTDTSSIQKIIDGDYENGIKGLVKTASDEVLNEVLKTIPFGGLAKKCIDSLVELLANVRKE